MAVVFLLYVVAEVAAVWAVASAIGLLPTLGLLLAGAIVGSWLARREGGKAAQAFMATARAGRSPHAEVTDGMLVGLGGLLILLPGFVTDIAGLLLLLPPTRGLARRAWLRRIERKAPAANRRHSGVIVVDSEVVRDRGDTPGQPRRPVIDSE
ncbi:protein affecting phage T7 exclusion by the F plasmid [Saccharomonospora marina XMU15]|uniref:Protein affecting phage T7 exclusion by the F plasmid n=1 Tax=Saccharomonospora marina XMU15 TaxID=882083 RepID=H5XC06_9PSEU|nr:FxsA family protein [Saccharomonospora marina]EHR53810.1 protein affecting phage T7 exclusion by the F plasmid [Saccharomonospora marina XMU15]